MEDRMARSFIARLYMVTEGYNRNQRVGITVADTPSLSGWLKPMTGHEPHAKPVNFLFEFLKYSKKGETARIHCNISSSSRTAGYRGAKVGESVNGYAGLYQVATIENFWKLEPLNEWDDDQNLRFRIRTHRGYILGKHTYSGLYTEELLNAQSGENMTFKAHVLKWL